ncbi:MAG: acetoacetate decarboxylase family protein [Sulfolobaceae archaeon]|nr:acetoacetate decarboxylase family protein [Sulfolobaceae archaeon]
MSFTPPLTRSGNSNIVPPPPWHYGVTYLSAHVRFTNAEEIIPEYLKTDGEGWIYVAEFISPAESKWEYMYEDPDLTQYMEGAIGLKVEFEGKSYLHYAFMWVDKDWALVRGWLDGFPKKIAKISMTKLHPLLPNYEKPKSGLIMGGYVTRGSEVLLKLKVILEEKPTNTKLPIADFGPLLQIRRFPSRGDDELDVHEVVTRVRDESKLGEVWKGNAEIVLRGGPNDELDKLNIKEVYGGYYYTQYFRVSKTVLLKRIVEKTISVK